MSANRRRDERGLGRAGGRVDDQSFNPVGLAGVLDQAQAVRLGRSDHGSFCSPRWSLHVTDVPCGSMSMMHVAPRVVAHSTPRPSARVLFPEPPLCYSNVSVSVSVARLLGPSCGLTGSVSSVVVLLFAH